MLDDGQYRRLQLTLGLRIYEETADVGSFDAVLGAAAISCSAELVSADRGFASVRVLTHPDPAAPDFLEQLGSG